MEDTVLKIVHNYYFIVKIKTERFYSSVMNLYLIYKIYKKI